MYNLPYYRLISKIQGGKITLSLEPKDPDVAKEQPLNFTHHFSFPSSAQSQFRSVRGLNGFALTRGARAKTLIRGARQAVSIGPDQRRSQPFPPD